MQTHHSELPKSLEDLLVSIWESSTIQDGSDMEIDWLIITEELKVNVTDDKICKFKKRISTLEKLGYIKDLSPPYFQSIELTPEGFGKVFEIKSSRAAEKRRFYDLLYAFLIAIVSGAILSPLGGILAEWLKGSLCN